MFRGLRPPLLALVAAGCFGRIPVDPKNEGTVPTDTGTSGDDTGGDGGAAGDGGADTGAPAPRIAVAPTSIDFGDVAVGCEATEVIGVEIVGDAELSVDAIALGGDGAFDLTVPTSGPWTLAPGETVEATVAFAPTSGGEVTGMVVVTSDDPDAPEVSVDLAGTGAVAGTVLDTFTQAIVDDTEVIFAVDTSGSMSDDLVGMVAAFPSFVSDLNAAGIDAHISAVLFGERCAVVSNPPWFDTSISTEDLADILGDIFDSDGFGGGSSDRESAFTTWEAAYGRSGSGQCNEGLFDASRDLNLVGISDEADAEASSWSTYVSDFQAINPTVRFHAIGGPPPTGCAYAERYSGVYEATADTGGAFLSICDDWEANFTALADAIVVAALQDTFPLADDPDPDTIEVTVNGSPATGWSYDAGANAVVFDADAVPALGASVEVAYQVATSCG